MRAQSCLTHFLNSNLRVGFAGPTYPCIRMCVRRVRARYNDARAVPGPHDLLRLWYRLPELKGEERIEAIAKLEAWCTR